MNIVINSPRSFGIMLMMLSMSFGFFVCYAMSVLGRNSFVFQLELWYVPFISLASVIWIPWLASRVTPIDAGGKVMGLCIVMGFIGFDLMRRVAILMYGSGCYFD